MSVPTTVWQEHPELDTDVLMDDTVVLFDDPNVYFNGYDPLNYEPKAAVWTEQE